MNVLTVIGQAFGFLAMALIVFSFQFKDNKKLFLLQVGSCLLFTAHYLLLGLGGDNAAFSGMAQSLLGLVFRTVLLLSARFPKLKSPVVMSLIAAAMAVASVLTYSGSPVALLPVLGNFVCLGAMWSDDANVIRFSQLICVSPSWLLYNVFMVSIAGIILESFNIISIIIYYIRRRLEARRSVGKEAADWEAALAEVNADAVTAEAVTVAEAVVRDETVAAAETGAHAEAVGLAETVAPAGAVLDTERTEANG